MKNEDHPDWNRPPDPMPDSDELLPQGYAHVQMLSIPKPGEHQYGVMASAGYWSLALAQERQFADRNFYLAIGAAVLAGVHVVMSVLTDEYAALGVAGVLLFYAMIAFRAHVRQLQRLNFFNFLLLTNVKRVHGDDE